MKINEQLLFITNLPLLLFVSDKGTITGVICNGSFLTVPNSFSTMNECN